MGLGWYIHVYRLEDGRNSPATAESRAGACIAEWETGLGGTDWLVELVKTGKAIEVAQNGGFPWTFTAPAEHIVPRILDGPPEAYPETGEFMGGTYTRATRRIDRDAAKQCRSDEWLMIEAWDQD